MKNYSVPLFTEGTIQVEAELDEGAPTHIETDNLILSPLFEADVDQIQSLDDRSDEHVTEYLKWTPKEEGNIEEFVGQSEEVWGDCYTYSVANKSGDFVGIVANNVEELLGRCDIGVWIAEPEWESIYAPEVFSALASVAFEFMNIELVKGNVDATNQRSIRSLQKSILGLGGSFEGLIRNHSKVPDEEGYRIRDIVVYSIGSDEFYTLRDGPKPLDDMIGEKTNQDANSMLLVL